MILDYLQGKYTINDLVIVSVIMIFALMFHNVLQAWVAYKMGDSGPRFAGFLRFDPQQHLELWGLGLLLVLGFGWPKMITTNSRNYKNRGRSEAYVWYAGPAAYLLVAFITILLAIVAQIFKADAVTRSFFLAASVATLHAVINLFPVYPLDGAKAALAWGNREVRNLVQQIASYGFMGFFVIFMLLSYTGIINMIISFFLNIFIAISSTIVNIFV